MGAARPLRGHGRTVTVAGGTGEAPLDDAFAAVSARLRAVLAAGRPRPGHDAHLRLAPSSRLDRALLSVEGKLGREAAVLVLLHPDAAGRACVVLTARRAELRDHAGQVAFPGGRREPGEAFVETALREAREELGLAVPAEAVVGPMTPLYIPPTKYRCHPFVALCGPLPPFVPHDGEVAEAFSVPLGDLFAPAARGEGAWTVNGVPTARVPYLRVGEHRVWGATAMMLAELHALLTGR